MKHKSISKIMEESRTYRRRRYLLDKKEDERTQIHKVNLEVSSSIKSKDCLNSKRFNKSWNTKKKK